MNSQSSQSDAFPINERRDSAKQFLIHPEDNDIFVRTGKQVIAACRLGISVELWMEEIAALISELAVWCRDRAGGRVRSCYFAPSGARVIFFIAPSSDRFDFDLADELADLGGNLSAAFNVGTVELHQVPWREIGRFLQQESAKHVYGERVPPSEATAS